MFCFFVIRLSFNWSFLLVMSMRSDDLSVYRGDEKREIGTIDIMESMEASSKIYSSGSNTKEAKFSINDYVVYPQHGVGKIIGYEEEEIAGCHLRLYVISFDREKMVLRVPLHRESELRGLSSDAKMVEVLKILEGRARIKRTMWSRRAQQYELKINSGDPISVAEVVRDLYRSDRQTGAILFGASIIPACVGAFGA